MIEKWNPRKMIVPTVLFVATAVSLNGSEQNKTHAETPPTQPAIVTPTTETTLTKGYIAGRVIIASIVGGTTVIFSTILILEARRKLKGK